MSRQPTASCLDDLARDIRVLVDERLEVLVPPSDQPPEALHRAMRYSLMGPGKRIRPMVTIMAASHFGTGAERALDPACAIEMVHTASLILDDLPSMDNAATRRGQPANHIAFGEDTAQLAAMALLNQAFAVLSQAPNLSAEVRIQLVETLTEAIGSVGLIAGQARDLDLRFDSADYSDLEETNALKTAALFVAGAEMGARIAGVAEDRVDKVRRFARYFGLAFQLVDDILDASVTAEVLGKDVGQDHHKPTFVSAMGLDSTRKLANAFIEASVSELATLSVSGDALEVLARSLRVQY